MYSYGIAQCQVIKLGDFRIENTRESSMIDVACLLIYRLQLVLSVHLLCPRALIRPERQHEAVCAGPVLLNSPRHIG